MLLRLMALVTAVVHMVSSQDSGGTILGQANAVDSQSVISTPRTTAFLSCESGDMVVKVNFTQPFRGLMYAHRSRSSPCRIYGAGGLYYELRIPLKGCGTSQESPRVFVNNVTIRFHPALELEEDETKTVVCRYPPPLTQPPGTIQIIEPHPISPTVSPTRVSTARLSEVEILLLICLLLFLSLLTLGIGIAYFCLKRRNVRIIRKGVQSTSAPPSQLTRLSSPNIPSTPSVLGHTVRIPRAVPYSAAPPQGRSPSFEEGEFVTSSSSAEGTSAEDTSVSTSSSEEQSRNLLYGKGGPKSILSIPKAILRKAGGNRWRTHQPVVHQYSTRTASAASTSVKGPEMEDQTVMTVLEPEHYFEEDTYWSRREREYMQQDRSHSTAASQSPPSNSTSPVPVYAQVDKLKKTTSTTTSKQEALLAKTPRKPPPPPSQPVPGEARRQRRVVTESPEERKTNEEVTKNTTVTTSVRREVKETRVLSPSLMKDLRDAVAKREGRGDALVENTSSAQILDQSSELATRATALNPQKPLKSILIRDVSDVYLTTTVETELRELTTKVSKDVVEQHSKTAIEGKPDVTTAKNVDIPDSQIPDTRNWNVIIRHRSPDVPVQEGTDLDASSESNGDSPGPGESRPTPEPQFHVRIRTIPPDELKPKKPDTMVSIPPLEMPASVGRLREALKPNVLEAESVDPGDEDDGNPEKPKDPKEEDSGTKSNQQQRTVRWTEDTKAASSTVSSSDSFQSSESLRERSSSEVLEVAPTLPSQQQKIDQPPMLERSTSEIVTSPEDHSRWIGGVVPVLESLSPEFLANIPVVIQGGFFNRQRPPTPADAGKDAKKV